MEPEEGKNIPTERKVADSLYGFISFPLEIWDFIDTPHFQRLRYIKQLGTLSWVFPGGGHSRFEHCLGTGHLAQKYIRTLIENHQKKPKLNPEVT
jgi:HD superfamily phosphohydrolase